MAINMIDDQWCKYFVQEVDAGSPESMIAVPGSPSWATCVTFQKSSLAFQFKPWSEW